MLPCVAPAARQYCLHAVMGWLLSAVNLSPIILKPSSVTFALLINSSLPKASLWYKDKFSAVPVQLP